MAAVLLWCERKIPQQGLSKSTYSNTMITPHIPTQIEQQSVNIGSAQHATIAEASNMLIGGSTSDIMKRLLLRYFVQRSIQENEAKQVVTGVEIVDMQSKQAIVSHNIDVTHFAASINKLPVVLVILEDLRLGKVSLDQKMTWVASDVRAGAGIYDQPGAPLEATLQDVIYDLLHKSGNTAVRVLVNGALGGAAAVNDRWALKPELSNTRLQPLDTNRFYLGDSTPHDSLWTMTELMKKQDRFTEVLKSALRDNIYTNESVRSQLAGNDYIVLVNKVGLLDDSEGNNRHDVGIIYNTKTKKSYGYSLFTTSPADSEEATPQAIQSLKDIGRYTLRYSGDKNRTVRTQQLPQHPVEQRIMY